MTQEETIKARLHQAVDLHAAKAQKEIREMAEFARRSIGQKMRWMREKDKK